MKYSNRNPRWKKVISSPVTIIILLILAVFLSRAVSNIGDKVTKIDQKLANANNEYQKLINREKILRERVEFLYTDEGIEAGLRSKYKAVSDGERVAVILEEKENPKTLSITSTTTQNVGWWKRLWQSMGF